MAYGENKAVAYEREIGFFGILGYGIAAAVGIGAAVIVDLLQQREGSALFVINKQVLFVTNLLGVDSIPLYGVMLLVMLVGAASVLYFQPVTSRGAFTQGFGVLAALVTLSPSFIGEPLPSSEDMTGAMPPMEFDAPMETEDAPEASEEASLAPSLVVPASLHPASASASASAAAAAAVQGRTEYRLRIEINFPDGLRSDFQSMVRRGRLSGKLWNPETGTVYNLFRSSGARMGYDDDALRIETTVGGVDGSADLWILVEADGYAIKEQQFSARAGANRIWTVNMEPSNTPLFLQRLNHSYRF